MISTAISRKETGDKVSIYINLFVTSELLTLVIRSTEP